VILPVVLYGCETWSLTLREKQRLRVFEKRVLRRIFGRKRDEVTRERRKLHKGEPHNLYSFPDVIRQIKSRRMRWARHVARMEKERIVYKIWWKSPVERDNSEDRGVDGRMGSQQMLGRLTKRVWIGFTWLKLGPVVGSCEHGEETSGSGAT
jgi:hypothetical protein